MAMQFAKIKNLFIETIFPSQCYNCRKPGSYLCINCFELAGVLPHAVCPHCGLRLPYGELPQNCKNELHLKRFFAAADYKNKIIKRLVHDMKYKRAYVLAQPLAELTHSWLQNSGYAPLFQKGNIALIPVPMHLRRARERGFNQSEHIAHHLSKLLNVPYEKNILIKIKNTQSQVDVKIRKERLSNISNAFAVKNPTTFKDKTVVLVDDVATTGATLAECARTLNKNGVREVWALTVAKD